MDVTWLIKGVRLPSGVLEIASIIELEDIPIPRAGQPLANSWAFLNLLLVATTILLMATALRDGRKSSMRFITLIPSLSAVITFLFTEDITSKMGLVDEWTIWMAAIFMIQVVILFLAEKGTRQGNGGMQSNT